MSDEICPPERQPHVTDYTPRLGPIATQLEQDLAVLTRLATVAAVVGAATLIVLVAAAIHGATK